MTLLSLCSAFTPSSWAEVGFSGKRWIWFGLGGQVGSVCPKRGSEAPRLAPPGACFALMCFWGDPAGAPLRDALSAPSLAPCCPLRAQEQPAPLRQGCHHSGTPPSSTCCPPHSIVPCHPALSASPNKTLVYLWRRNQFSLPEEPFPTAWQGPGHIRAAPVGYKGSLVLSRLPPGEGEGSKATVGGPSEDL